MRDTVIENLYCHYLHFDRYRALFYNISGVITVAEQEMRKHRCCFTGHRPQKLSRSESAIKSDLEKAIVKAIGMGYQTFITGMAYGVDIWAGQIVVELRKNNPDLHLIAAIPFPGFESRWSNEWRQAYADLLGKADLVRYICPSYNAGAYQRRNEWMVDHSAHLIAVYDGASGGTRNTIDYAKRCGITIEQISG